MRHALLSFLLLVAACSSAPERVIDGGTNLAGCFIPPDGGVFLSGLPAPVPGCVADAGPTGVLDLAALGWLRSGGVLVVPPEAAAGKAVPVVFAFHGAGESGEAIRDALALGPSTDAGVILVFPNAAAQGTWDIRPVSADGRNVDALIQQLSDRTPTPAPVAAPAVFWMTAFSSQVSVTSSPSTVIAAPSAVTEAARGVVPQSDVLFVTTIPLVNGVHESASDPDSASSALVLLQPMPTRRMRRKARDRCMPASAAIVGPM